MKPLSSIIYKFRRIVHHCLPKKGKLGHFVELTIEKESNTIIGNNFRVATAGVVRSYNHATLQIGDNFQSNNNLMIICRHKIIIGSDVTIGPNVCIVDFNHDYHNENLRDNYILGDISIGSNVWIGAGVIILPNSIIGDNCVIGAASIVTGIVPPNTIYFNKLQKKFIEKE